MAEHASITEVVVNAQKQSKEHASITSQQELERLLVTITTKEDIIRTSDEKIKALQKKQVLQSQNSQGSSSGKCEIPFPAVAPEEMAEQVSMLSDLILQLEEEIALLQYHLEVAYAHQSIPTYTVIAADNARIEDLESRLNSLTTVEQLSQSLTKSISKLDKQKEEFDREINSLTKQLESANLSLQKAQKNAGKQAELQATKADFRESKRRVEELEAALRSTELQHKQTLAQSKAQTKQQAVLEKRVPQIQAEVKRLTEQVKEAEAARVEAVQLAEQEKKRSVESEAARVEAVKIAEQEKKSSAEAEAARLEAVDFAEQVKKSFVEAEAARVEAVKLAEQAKKSSDEAEAARAEAIELAKQEKTSSAEAEAARLEAVELAEQAKQSAMLAETARVEAVELANQEKKSSMEAEAARAEALELAEQAKQSSVEAEAARAEVLQLCKLEKKRSIVNNIAAEKKKLKRKPKRIGSKEPVYASKKEKKHPSENFDLDAYLQANKKVLNKHSRTNRIFAVLGFIIAGLTITVWSTVGQMSSASALAKELDLALTQIEALKADNKRVAAERHTDHQQVDEFLTDMKNAKTESNSALYRVKSTQEEVENVLTNDYESKIRKLHNQLRELGQKEHSCQDQLKAILP
jgi:hypothetical protein